MYRVEDLREGFPKRQQLLCVVSRFKELGVIWRATNLQSTQNGSSEMHFWTTTPFLDKLGHLGKRGVSSWFRRTETEQWCVKLMFGVWWSFIQSQNRMFKFDYKKMNMFKFVQCSKNDVWVCSMRKLLNLVIYRTTFKFLWSQN